MNEITCELPPCEERDLDYHHLKELTFRATQKTLAILKSMEVSEKVLLIYRGDNTSVRGYQVPFPNYREKSVWKGNHLDFLSQLLKLTDEFLKSNRIVIKSNLFNQDPVRRNILLTLNISRIIQHFWITVKEQNAAMAA